MTREFAEPVYELAKTLFASAEWPYIQECLESCLPEFTQVQGVDGEVAAFVIVNASVEGIAFLSYCGVSKKHQGKGFGSKLLKMAIHTIFQADYSACRLYVDLWNTDARRLYERLGFKQIGTATVAGSDCWLLELARAYDGGSKIETACSYESVVTNNAARSLPRTPQDV
jgi:ribosomal protein S18 acetylase RimI-like enzyme